MSSINNGVDFIYGGMGSEQFGVKLATSFGSFGRSSNTESRDIITSNNPSLKTFGFHGVKYTSPNSFDLIIYNEDGSLIDEYQERRLKKWLMSSKMNWLQIDQNTLYNISYYCIGTKFEILNIGAFSGAILISFQCDSTGAWSKANTKTYTTSNGTLSFRMVLDTDYDDEIIRPSLNIVTNSSGNIYIKNVTRNETISINDCESGEVIILDGNSYKINTTSSTLLLDRWSKNFLKLQDGYNDILLTGDFNLNISYRQQIRIGG
jgi:hypothetical protein